MRQTSKVITRDNEGKRRHYSLLAPELHAPAGRNARKWSERSTKDGGSPYQAPRSNAKKDARQRRPHITSSVSGTTWTNNNNNKYSRLVPRNEDWSSYDTFCTGVL